MSIVSRWGQNGEECHKSHFLNISNKKGRCLQRHRLEGMTIYFLARSAEHKLVWCSLNSHPFVCHGVYLYIANLHQANLIAQKRGKGRRKKNAYENAAAVRGQYSQNKKDALREVPYNNIHVIWKVTTEVSCKMYGKYFSKTHRDRKWPIIILHPACCFSQMKNITSSRSW